MKDKQSKYYWFLGAVKLAKFLLIPMALSLLMMAVGMPLWMSLVTIVITLLIEIILLVAGVYLLIMKCYKEQP